MAPSAPSIITAESERTSIMKARAAEAPRNIPRGRVAGSWIMDLAALSKAITLCFGCQRKFDHKRCGYHPTALLPTSPYVIGDCDGCRESLVRCTLFVKQI